MTVNAITSRSDLVGPDRGDGFIKNFDKDFNSRHHPPGLELRTISFFRDDLIRGTYVNHLDPEDVVEDVSRLAFLAVRDCNSSDLAVIETALSQRLLDGEILGDIMRAFATVTVPLSSYDLAYCMRHVGEYIKLRKVMGHMSILQDLDSPNHFAVPQDFYPRLAEECSREISAGRNGDTSLYRFSTTEDFLRARDKANPTGVTIPSHFGLVNACLPGGFATGTVTMVVGPPGVGKSTLLAIEAVAAAMNGHLVYLIVLGDLGPFDIWCRCTAIFLRLPIDVVVRDAELLHEDPRVRDLFERIELKCVGAYELGAGDIYKDAVARKNRFDYGMILIDYDGNIKSKEGTLYAEGGVTYGKFDQIAKHTNTALITACQPKQEFWDKELLTLKSAGESSKKQHVCDLIITLSRPTSVPVGTLHIPKARRGRSGHSRFVAYAGRYARIIEISSTEQIHIETIYRDARSGDEADTQFYQWVDSKVGTDSVPRIHDDGGKDDD